MSVTVRLVGSQSLGAVFVWTPTIVAAEFMWLRDDWRGIGMLPGGGGLLQSEVCPALVNASIFFPGTDRNLDLMFNRCWAERSPHSTRHYCAWIDAIKGVAAFAEERAIDVAFDAECCEISHELISCIAAPDPAPAQTAPTVTAALAMVQALRRVSDRRV